MADLKLVPASLPTAPPGWKLVPLAPTNAMLAAGQMAWVRDPLRKSSTLYRAMVEAAPPCGVATSSDAQRLVDECAPYLKDGETPAQCIERNRKDANAAVGLLAKERAKLAAQPVAFEFYNAATGHAIVDYTEHTHVGHLTAEAGYTKRPLVYASGVSVPDHETK